MLYYYEKHASNDHTTVMGVVFHNARDGVLKDLNYEIRLHKQNLKMQTDKLFIAPYTNIQGR